MNVITTRFLAAFVAAAVLFTFSAPAEAALYATASGANSSHGRLQTDDDDDELSGGALAVLLLAIGGAVAGDVYGPGSLGTQSKLSMNRSASTATVSIERNRFRKRTTTAWTSVLVQSAGTIRLSGNGRQWTGKTDGRYYAISGDPNADELSIMTNNRSLEFKTRKAGRSGYGGTITISDDGQSVTMKTSGGRGSRQVVFSAR